jgi:hypothetical protein
MYWLSSGVAQPLPKPLLPLMDSAIQWIDVTPLLAKRAGRALPNVRGTPSAVDALVATVDAASETWF